MIDRLSFSSLRCYLSDKQQFKKQYLEGQWDDMGDAVYVGKACHRMIEAFLGHEIVPLAKDALAYECAEMLAQKKALQDVETAVKETQTSFDSFLEYYADHEKTFKPVVIEGKYIVHPEALPYYLKGFVDVVHQNDDGRVTVMDWKTVGRWTPEKGSMAHRLQAVFYMMLLEATDMTPNYTGQFVELHRKKRGYKVHTYAVEPEEITAMRDLCTLAYEEITTLTNHFLPNPFSMFGGEESWLYFVASRRNE